MPVLTRRDGHRLLEAVALLEAGFDAETFPARAVAALGAIIDADLISYNEVDVVARVNRVLLVPDIDDVSRVVGVHYQMAVVIARDAARQVALAVHRATRDFSQHDRAVAETLRPHITRHYRMCLIVADLRARCLSQTESAGAMDARTLTAREAQVLHWVARGLRNEEVARQVGARPLTVKKHLEHAYAKLGVHSRTAAVMKLATMETGITAKLR